MGIMPILWAKDTSHILPVAPSFLMSLFAFLFRWAVCMWPFTQCCLEVSVRLSWVSLVQNEEELSLCLRNSVPLWSSPCGTHLFVYLPSNNSTSCISTSSVSLCVLHRLLQSLQSHQRMVISGHLGAASFPKLLAVVWGVRVSADVNLTIFSIFQLSNT